MGIGRYEQRTADVTGEAPLHKVLRWILQQINFGHVVAVRDERGDESTLIIGRDAAEERQISQADCVKNTRERDLAVMLAGSLAEARDAGTDSATARFHEKLRGRASTGAVDNTEFYYTFDFVRTLSRIHKRSFGFVPMVLEGKAPARVSECLREATRCYYLRLNLGCMALCRVCLEASLKHYVSDREVCAAKQPNPKKGDLQLRIQFAQRMGCLDSCHASVAEEIRRRGNDVLHGTRALEENEAFETLLKTRAVVEHLFPADVT